METMVAEIQSSAAGRAGVLSAGDSTPRRSLWADRLLGHSFLRSDARAHLAVIHGPAPGSAD